MSDKVFPNTDLNFRKMESFHPFYDSAGKILHKASQIFKTLIMATELTHYW